MNTAYLIHVVDYPPELLPRPTPKMEKSEELSELPIITMEVPIWNSE